MTERRALSPGRLLLVRAWTRIGLLSSAAATAAVAVTTVMLVFAWLARAVAEAGDPPPPGVSPAELADQVDAGAAALMSAAPALVLLVLILAATALAQLARLVAAAREHESATIRARGFSRPQAWTADAAEGLAVAAAGAVAGLLLAGAIAAAVGVPPLDVLAQWQWALGSMLVLAIVFAVALRRGERRASSTRVARTTTAALVAIVLLASALVVWQLPNAQGAGFDPIVAIAPAVLLSSGAVLALAAFGAAAVAWSGPASAGPSLEPGYPARQVARRLPIYAVAALLVAFTVAQAVFASAYSATWTAMTTDSSAVIAGADLRVDMSPQSASPADVGGAAVDGVEATAPALVAEVEIGSNEAQLVSVPASAVETVVTSAGGLIDKKALLAQEQPASTLIVDSQPVPLGDGATGVRVTAHAIASSGVFAGVGLAAVVLDASGTPAAVQLDGRFVPDGEESATLVAESALPDGTAPWRLLAIVGYAARNTTITIDGADAVGGDALEVQGGDVYIASGTDAVVWLGDGGVLGEAPLQQGDDVDNGLPPITAAVTATLAAQLGVGVGDPLEFRYSGTGRSGEAIISSIVDVVPGSSSAASLFVPMDMLMTSQLQRGTSVTPPNSVWASGSSSAADGMSAALNDRPVQTSAPGVAQALVGALIPGWWIAAAGSIVLSLVAAFAIVQTLAIGRRRELGVLRALGVTTGRQARMRAAELAGVFGAALVLGAAAGALVSWLIVPDLVRAVTPGILTIAGGVSIAWEPLAVAAVVLGVGLAAIVAAAALDVGRTAGSATVAEEVR